MRRRRRPRNPIWTFTLTWLFLSFLVNFRGLGLLLALGTAGLAAYIFGSTPAKSAEQRQREEEAKRRQEAYARLPRGSIPKIQSRRIRKKRRSLSKRRATVLR